MGRVEENICIRMCNEFVADEVNKLHGELSSFETTKLFRGISSEKFSPVNALKEKLNTQ